MDTKAIEQLLVNNDSLFNHLYVIYQDFNIQPAKKHYGMAINFMDLKESRTLFIEELVNTILDWVYGQSKQESILNEQSSDKRTIGNNYSAMYNSAIAKFRKSEDGRLLHGQFGELLLSNCIQRFFHAVPILRKMPITTSTGHERFGADAIHFRVNNGKSQFFLGESKCYSSDYKFNVAFDTAISSILDTYENHQNELKLYIHEDFLEDELKSVASNYLKGKLKNPEIHLVNIVAYNETRKIIGSCESDIKNCIKGIITSRFSSVPPGVVDCDKNQILRRITYIVFPIWQLDRLLGDFSKYINR